jgi:hypothetical protein
MYVNEFHLCQVHLTNHYTVFTVAEKQTTTRTANTKTGQKRKGKKHITEIFIDDDSPEDDAATVMEDAYADDSYDDDQSSSVRGTPKGMAMGMMGSKHYDTDYRVDDFYPRAKDLEFVDDMFFDDQFVEGDDCELVTFNETFGMSSADLFLAPDTTIDEPGNPMYAGTVFVFEREFLLQPDGTTSINGTVVSGTCTRTEGGKDTSGAGLCNFVFVDDEGYSINVNGLLVGPLGGKLAISGGTGGMLGVVGEMDFMPIYEDSKTIGDIFLDPIRYDVMAHLGLIVCP